MYEIIFHPEAIDEFDDAKAWHEKEVEGLGETFKADILIQITLIQINPEIFPSKKRGFRESVVQTFPYIIVYIVSEKLNTIFISAIYHTSRNPRKKYRR